MADTAAPPVAKELIARLPRTFGPAFNDQLGNWDMLFPPERRQLRAQVEWLSELSPADFKQLFAPMVEVESRMDLPPWQPNAKGISVEDAGILARSPLYGKWRTEVEQVFSRIDEGAKKPVRRNRLVICILPPGVPLKGEPLWPELEKQGKWVQLAEPFGAISPAMAAALASRKRKPDVEDIEGTWVVECESRFASLTEAAATVLSWSALAEARREFLTRLNTIRRDLKSVDQTNLELRRLDISRLMGPAMNKDARVREFVRSVFLTGNGSLVFPNSFVQWAASEGLRRAEPQALIAAFGIRRKIKPFSGAVLFEDQGRGNPVPDQDDPAGSLVDGLMLSEYVYLAAQRVDAYRGRTLFLMAAHELDRVLVIGAEAPAAPMTAGELTGLVSGWLS